jgi:hypothetical protein
MRRVFLSFAALVSTLGLLLVSGPLANAATNRDDTTKDISFGDHRDIAADCTVHNNTGHNNDDPNQPYTRVIGFSSGDSNACTIDIHITVTVTYKDKDGIGRTSTIASAGQFDATIGGTYSAINTSVAIHYNNCDYNAFICDATATSHPK